MKKETPPATREVRRPLCPSRMYCGLPACMLELGVWCCSALDVHNREYCCVGTLHITLQVRPLHSVVSVTPPLVLNEGKIMQVKDFNVLHTKLLITTRFQLGCVGVSRYRCCGETVGCLLPLVETSIHVPNSIITELRYGIGFLCLILDTLPHEEISGVVM